MKKALILAYDFPPYNSIGGQRPKAWYQYFRSFGLEPIVVTRHWDVEITKPEDCYLPSVNQSVVIKDTEHGRVIRVPFNPKLRDRLIAKSGIIASMTRRLLSLLSLLFEHHLSIFDNKRSIYYEADKLLKAEKFDYIIATGEPFVLFSYAAKLSKKHRVPWIADYRDGWSTNYNAERGIGKLINSVWLRRIEKSVVNTAKVVTTAAPAFAEELRELLGRTDIHVLYNGYFEELHQSNNATDRNNRFTICHAGTVYPFQKVETFLSGLSQFTKKTTNADLDVIFYGLNFQMKQVQRIEMASSGLPITFTARMSHDEILDNLRKADVQLLLTTPEKHQIYAKVFDYIGTGRPILMVENDQGPLEEILGQRSNATICSTPEEVCDYLSGVYQNRDELITVSNEDDTFTRRNQTRILAELVKQTIEK